MKRPIPGQKHHWFPKVMAKAWVDSEGKVSRTNSRSFTTQKHPSAVGYYPDHHNILSDGGSPWDSTFEPDFDDADNAFPKVIGWLDEIASSHPSGKRIGGVTISSEMRTQLAECLASLIVRSPRMRYLSEKYTAEYQVEWMGFDEPRNVHQTAGANLRRCQEPFARSIRTGGKFAFLVATEGYFVFGDGFMSNFNPSPDCRSNLMALTAFTPSVALLWFSPRQYPSYPDGVTILVSKDEVVQFNDIVQVYSKDNIFHRGLAPNLHESFLKSQHYIVTSNGANHTTPLVEGWMFEALQVREDWRA
ncbi:DUF4238 domain-containing protein [Brevundimonas sp. ZS04]|uniref:DUF4238 domain-containing protein n=1 Tax=Brevundimonas sp. ZS04 TaxID=1906854 RepID=UPI001177AA4D|nr:DUF4238 domain-containing protein [Brevundimonas sp. ZS04]